MIIFLDTGPLGAIINPNPKSAEVKQIIAWGQRVIGDGHTLVVPAVADYEQRREHLLRDAHASTASLDAFLTSTPGRYLELTDSALKRAAVLWAEVRKMGLPPADQQALDCDILLVSQVLDLMLPEGSFIVATSNTRHLSRFVACDIWQNILP